MHTSQNILFNERIKTQKNINFHLYQVQEQAKLIYGPKSQKSGYPWGGGCRLAGELAGGSGIFYFLIRMALLGTVGT